MSTHQVTFIVNLDVEVDQDTPPGAARDAIATEAIRQLGRGYHYAVFVRDQAGINQEVDIPSYTMTAILKDVVL